MPTVDTASVLARHSGDFDALVEEGLLVLETSIVSGAHLSLEGRAAALVAPRVLRVECHLERFSVMVAFNLRLIGRDGS